LGQALAYVSNLVKADQAMVEEFQNDARTPQSIVAAIKTAHETEAKDFSSIERAPKNYGGIAVKLAKIHSDHEKAFLAYALTFQQPDTRRMEQSIDRGNKLLKESMLNEMSKVKDLIMSAMERDVASQ
jgi:septation ring formation regulator EzrA